METLNHIDGERDIPNVNQANTARWMRGTVVVICLVLARGFAVMGFAKFNTKQVEPDNALRVMTQASSVPARSFDFAVEPEPVTVVPVAAPALPVQPVVVQPVPVKRAYKPAPRPVVDKSASGALVVSQHQNGAGQGVQVAQAGSNGGGDLFGGGGSELGQALTPTKMDGVSAARLPHMQYMLTRGQTIDCALTTRIVTSVPGLTSCNVTRNVYSADGTRVLLASGSRVTGEYQSATRQGSRRIFVLWSRVQTPDGIIVDLNSPGTDALGSSGIPGNVDTHFWQRFGGAMLLSLIDDAAQIAVNKSSNANENTQIVLGSTTDTANELAAEVLRNTINIPPTVYTHQGARISIFIARDVDFSAVLR